MANKVGLTDAKIAGLKAPTAGQIELADGIVPGLRLRMGASGIKTYILRNFSGGGQGFRVGSPLEGADGLAESADDLLAVLEECSQDLRYGIDRLGKILDIARPLLCTCFNGKGGNQMLMKYLDGRKGLVEKVMGRFYQDFLDSLNFNGQNSPAEEPRFSSRFALGK